MCIAPRFECVKKKCTDFQWSAYGGCLPSPLGTSTDAMVVCPQIFYTDVNDFIGKANPVVGAPGAAAQRITSSTWKRSVGGMVRPRAWAVLRLMTNSYWGRRSTGRSPGLAPFRILSTYVAARRAMAGRLRP
jgi:hypothetical protein